MPRAMAYPRSDLSSEQHRARQPQRLATRLFVSHAVLALILVAAVGITLAGLIGMRSMIAEVNHRYLADFEEEEAVHRSAWAFETAARHGASNCDPQIVRPRLQQATRDLEALLRAHAGRLSPAMEHAAKAYLAFGRRVVAGDVCTRLRDPAFDRERLELDEQLTDSWITKLRELRLAISEREQAAHRLGSVATYVGLALGCAALLAAALIARAVARGVTVPLAAIAAHARRVGEGDFSPLPSIGDPYEVAQLSRELERMRARLSEVNQLKEAFLGSVSHDLRTPLTHMREALSLLMDGTVGALNSRQQRVAALALRACEREIRLVSALLDLSRIRSGQPLRIVEGQRIDDIVGNALESVYENAQRANVLLKRESGGAIPPVRVDAVLIESALVNVLDNAIAASGSGGEVRIRQALRSSGASLTSPRGPWLQIVIEDDGAGVAPALRATIFEPFFTTKGSVGVGGSGLGLPLARDMVRAHGGDLTLLESERGAAFAIWLPLATAQESERTLVGEGSALLALGSEA